MRCSLASSVAVLVALIAFTPALPQEGRSDDLVFIQKGTLPIIISAPHGGLKPIPEVAERLGVGIANFQTVLDVRTAELTEAFAAELEKQLKGKPWVVLARFDRRYLDVNRPSEQAYESDKAKPYYGAYHDALERACQAVHKQFGQGLLLDIHGQGEFRDAICRGTQNGKTVTLLRERHGWQALTGKRSVLGHLERNGYKILPACTADPKTKEERKFSGAHIVGTYGSHTGYGIDAIQLEFGSLLRDKFRSRYATTASDLADAVAAFHEEYLKDAKK